MLQALSTWLVPLKAKVSQGKQCYSMGGGPNQLSCTLRGPSVTPLKSMVLCLLLPGWIKLSDISSKGVISYASFLELARYLYKVQIHKQSLIRNAEEGGV